MNSYYIITIIQLKIKNDYVYKSVIKNYSSCGTNKY